MEWMITAASHPLEDEARWEELQDDLLEILEGLGTHGVTGWGRIGELGALFTVEAPDIAEAASVGADVFQGALQKLGGPQAVRLEVEPADGGGDGAMEPHLERRLTAVGPSIPAISASEVAERLGVSRQRVYQLLEEHDDFPRPVAETPRGAVWSRREVEQWTRKPRRPGRPRKGRPNNAARPQG